MNQSFLKEKKITSLVLSMALPATLSMLVNALYNIIDSFFVAKISDQAMTALSLVFPLQNLVTAATVGFGIAMNVLISFYLGAEKKDMANRVTSFGILCNALQGVALTVGCIWGSRYFLALFTKDTEIINLGWTYSKIVFSFCVPIAISISFEKIFQAVGRMTVSMICMMAGCITNIILDPLLIFGIGIFPELGMTGAAIATVIGQVVTLLGYLIFYLATPVPVKVQASKLKPNGKLCKDIYMIAIPATLNMALPSLQVSVLNGILSSFADGYVMILGVYYKLQTFIYLTANGVVQGMRPLIGYNYGAGEYKRVKETFIVSLRFIAGLMLMGALLCMLIPQQLIGLFSSNEEILRIGSYALRMISIGFLPSALSITVSGELEGLGKGMPSLVISLCRFVVIMILSAWILSRAFGANGVWYAFGVTECCTALISFAIYKKECRFTNQTGVDMKHRHME